MVRGFLIFAVSVVVYSLWVLETRPGRTEADLTLANGPEPESLDPAIATTQSDGRIALTLYEGLTRYNAVDASPEPGLAASWSVSGDGRVYVFELRPNLRWSDGTAMTAEDVVASWRRVVDPETGAGYGNLMAPIQNAMAILNGEESDLEALGVKALTGSRVRVELEAPTPYFLSLCAHWTYAITPTEHIQKHGQQWASAFPTPTSGAYTPEFWRLNDRLRARQNPHYWDAENVQLEVVDFLPVTAPNVALNLYESGMVDVIWDKGLYPTELLKPLSQRPDFHTFRYLGTYFIRFNVTAPPFDDSRVRLAFSKSIDRQALVDRMAPVGETPAHSLTPPGIPGYRPPEGIEFDPDSAKRLLAEAGYPNGEGFPNVEYFFNSSAAGAGALHERIAVDLQAAWKSILGVTIGLRRAESKAFIAAQRSLEYDFSRSSWVGDYNDPYTFLEVFRSDNRNNRTGWTSEAYDRDLDAGAMAATPQERERLYQRAERRLTTMEAPIAPLFFYSGMHSYRSDQISGIHPNVLDQHPVRAIRKSSISEER